MKSKELENKVCENCIHYFVSGMLQNWGGNCWYCLLIQNDEKNAIYTKSGTRKANPKAIVQANHTCDKFESKN